MAYLHCYTVQRLKMGRMGMETKKCEIPKKSGDLVWFHPCCRLTGPRADSSGNLKAHLESMVPAILAYLNFVLEYQWVSLQEMINDLFGRFLHISIYVVYARLLGSWHTCTSSHWPWTPKKNRAPPLLTFRELAKPWRWLWISQGINMF